MTMVAIAAPTARAGIDACRRRTCVLPSQGVGCYEPEAMVPGENPCDRGSAPVDSGPTPVSFRGEFSELVADDGGRELGQPDAVGLAGFGQQI